jgi:hypothetical protein
VSEYLWTVLSGPVLEPACQAHTIPISSRATAGPARCDINKKGANGAIYAQPFQSHRGYIDMKILALIASLLLCAAAQAQTASTSFTLGLVTADCIRVLSQDSAATPPGQTPAVCPGGFFGGGSYAIYLLNDPNMSGLALTAYCQDTFGPLVNTSKTTATVTTTLTECSGNGTEVYSGSVIYNYALKIVKCRLGGCPTWVSVGGSGTLTLVSS